MKKSRKELIAALAYSVEIMCGMALSESQGAIKSALECDSKIWEMLDERTIRILNEGLNIHPPEDE